MDIVPQIDTTGRKFPFMNLLILQRWWTWREEGKKNKKKLLYKGDHNNVKNKKYFNV